MPFQSEKQRRYLWANEPEIARDWTDTYGSRIHKNEGGIMQAGVKNYLGKQKMVKAPLHWQSSPDHPKTELAYITQAEKDLLVKRDLHNSLHGGVNRGPAGIMSLNGWGSSDPGQNRAGADISAGMDRDPGHKGWSAPGGFTSPHAKSPAELKSLADRKGSSTVMPSSFYGNQSTNRGINFSFPGQNFMRNINPLQWAGNLIDNPFVSGAWSFLTSPFSGMSNLRQGMTQQEWEDARNERIRNKRIENILGREAPITDMTLKNLERLGYTGEMPGVGSTPTSRAIAKDFEREGDDITYARSHLASLADQMGITGTQTAKRSAKDYIDLSKSYSEFDTIPVDKYKGFNVQRNYEGEPIGSDLVQEAKLFDLALNQMRVLERKKAYQDYGGEKFTPQDQKLLDRLKEMDKEEEHYHLPIV